MSDKMKKAISEVIEGSGLLEQFEEAIAQQSEFHLKVTAESTALMPLIIEVVGREVAVCHTFVQQGDVMRDPEIVFDGRSWLAVGITQDPIGHYQRVPKGTVSRGIEELADSWAGNLQPYMKSHGASYTSMSHTL